MAFTIKPNWENLQWIRKNIRKVALKVEIAAHDQWATEGGSGAEETQPTHKKIVSIDLIRRFQYSSMSFSKG